MPQKANPSRTAASNVQAIVRTGPKEVTVHPSRHGKRQPQEKPTTTRALVLRNGKYGAMGSGEIIASNKITGREKLDLLAEDLMEKMKQAVMSPFKLEQALNISESQFGLYRDDIINLKDPELFRDLIEADLVARTPPGVEPRRNATNLAKITGTRIHNSYMLASAWKIVTDTLRSLALDGVTDKNIKTKLKNEQAMRERYLVLFDMVNTLVDMSHSKLSVLATTAPHYANFFNPKPAELSTSDSEPEVTFKWTDTQNLRAMTQSFLDSILIELCFPGAPFPKHILYLLLKECLDESPQESKRLSQAMSDALGDLAFCVELQVLLEAPLLGPDGEVWKKESRQMPEEFDRWIDAQFFSAEASNIIANWKDLTYPLPSTRKKEVLTSIWKTINLNYKDVSGLDIDTVWQLDGVFEITPQWSSYWIPSLAEDEDEEDDGGMPRLGKAKRKKPLAIMGPDDADDSAGSMPALQSVSNSSEDEDYSDFDSDDDEDEYEDASSAYDTDEEDEVRELIREAMEIGHEIDWFDTTLPAPELDPLKAEDRKGNPFLKALGSLRGRLFKSDPKIKVTTTRTEPRPNARGAFRATPSGVPKTVPKTAPPKPTPASAAPEAPVSHKTTMEEVEDEDAAVGAEGKKKKKKKGKKKRTGEGNSEVPQSPGPAAATPRSPISTLDRTPMGASASTLNIPIETTQAQSSRSYLKEIQEKEAKIKSRPDHASLFSQSSQETAPKSKSGGFLSKITKGLKGKKEDEHGNKNPTYTWFSRLSKKATDAMHQVLKTSEAAGKQPAPMKWETFVKLMKEMGFEYDPSTAGSSVRFTPPNKNDRPISIHKPHPDATLNPVQLRKIAKRLKRHYGWNEEDFVQQTKDATA